MKIRIRIEAARDIVGIFRYLQERSPNGADNVARAINQCIDLIGQQPYAGQLTREPYAGQLTRAETIRIRIVSRYPYKIFYSVGPEEIEILHIRHAARRPWPPAV